jgi:hypothetical protein
MANYSIGNLGRRDVLRMTAVLAGSGVVFPAQLANAETRLRRTPARSSVPSIPLAS